MKWVLNLPECVDAPTALVGGKARALARWQASGARVPAAAVVTSPAYEAFLRATGLDAQLYMELGRKDFADMRWEELWDAALRIRHFFLAAAMPRAMEKALADQLSARLLAVPVVVRSSAPEEDAAQGSFAGLHESFVNVRGWPAVRHHLRLVWASLWSDRALLYRQELGLDVQRSRMAVIVQELVVGQCSGVAFSRSPARADEALIEAVWGLNQGLVDGTVEPDRWHLARAGGTILAHVAPARRSELVPGRRGLGRHALTPARAARPPLGQGWGKPGMAPGLHRRAGFRGAAGCRVDGARWRTVGASGAAGNRDGQRNG